MPMLMLKCKSCGEIFPGVYVNEEKNDTSMIKNLNMTHTCSRGHKNDYVSADYLDWSGPEEF
jgi:hypothetical protein